jgi:hypothetical protein
LGRRATMATTTNTTSSSSIVWIAAVISQASSTSCHYEPTIALKEYSKSLSMRRIRSSPRAFIGLRRHIGIGYTEAAVIHSLFALVTRHVIAMQFAALGAPGI